MTPEQANEFDRDQTDADGAIVRAQLKALFTECTERAMAIVGSGRPVAWKADWKSLKEMLSITGYSSRDTLISKAKTLGVGVNRDGQWRFDLNRWEAVLEGRPYPKLVQHLGDNA